MAEAKWYKGNIHAHTTMSDGDAPPEKVVRWYRRHAYDFLVLSDHNHLTLLDYGSNRPRRRRPLMIPGEELSVNLHGGAIAVHVNGIGISRMVEPIDADEVVPTIQANVNAILQAGGIASINHPNYAWSFDHEAIKQVSGASLLEVFNGHPSSNVHGAPCKFTYEQIWDGVLSSGRAIFGVATDDSHNFYDFAHDMSNPGRGWLMVRAPELTRESIVEAMASGEFYATTGVALSEIQVSEEGIELTIEQEREYLYTSRFTGPDGALLAESTGLQAAYQVRGDEGYVRATVHSSSGPKAWTQPVFTR